MTEQPPGQGSSYPEYPGDGPPPPSVPAYPQAYPQPPHPGQVLIPVDPPRPADGLALAAIGVASLYALADVVKAVLAFFARSSYLEAADNGTDAFDVYTPYDFFGIAYVPFMIAAYVVTCLWLYRARTNVDALRPYMHHTRNKGWAWGSWVCPIVSLWFPFQFVRDLVRRDRSHKAPAVFGWWWALFLVMLLTSRIGSSLLPIEGEIDRDLVEALPIVETVSAGATLLALVLWISVVRRIRADQRALFASPAAPAW